MGFPGLLKAPANTGAYRLRGRAPSARAPRADPSYAAGLANKPIADASPPLGADRLDLPKPLHVGENRRSAPFADSEERWDILLTAHQTHTPPAAPAASLGPQPKLRSHTRDSRLGG